MTYEEEKKVNESGFSLNKDTMSAVEEIGKHMPGGFFIYKAKQPEELLYANQSVLDIFGCSDMDEFKELTGFTFKGMLYPDDYYEISQSINDQIKESDVRFDHVIYRIVRKDGKIRWVDDYGHYAESEEYGGIYYVFISDITQRKENEEKLALVTNQMITALSADYRCVYYVVLDTDEGTCYRTDNPYENSLRVGEQFSFNEVFSSYCRKFVDEEYREGFLQFIDPVNIRKSLENEKVIFYRYLIHRDGRDSYEMLRMAGVSHPKDKDSKKVHAVGIALLDVDEEK